MSAGTFTLNPGPPTPGIEAGTIAGAVTAGTYGGGVTPVANVVGALAARIKDAPTVAIQQAYMRACREFCKESRWLKRNIAQATLVNGQAVYNFGADPVLETIGVSAAVIIQQNGTKVGLKYTDQGTYDPNMAPDLPNWYSYLDDGMIVFYPPPNYAYGAILELVVQTIDMVTSIPNDLLRKWNRTLEAGAEQFLREMKDEKWYDPALAMKAENKFWEGISSARAWRARGYQEGSQRATPRPFLSR